MNTFEQSEYDSEHFNSTKREEGRVICRIRIQDKLVEMNKKNYEIIYKTHQFTVSNKEQKYG